MKAIAKKIVQSTSCKNGLKSRFCVVLGLQYGFEGKYKMLDKLVDDYDYSIRFNGGSTNDPVQMQCGREISLLPYGIQKEFDTKCLLGNGVIIDPHVLLQDFSILKRNGVDFERKTIISERCHFVTALHREIKSSLRAARNDRIWISDEDICSAFKPLKMGLRTAILYDEPWEGFVDTYDRILKTGQQIYNVKVSREAREKDLQAFAEIKKVMTATPAIVQDSITLLNDEIFKNNKRCLVEDCSSTSMDMDTGIYPYTDSFNTNTGAVCTGLGIPEEAIETTIGVFSAISMMDRAFLQNINSFPTRIQKNEPGVQSIISKLDKRYLMPEADYEAGWTDMNVLAHAERTNMLSSIFLTHLDLLDDLDEIKVCTGYTTESGQIKNRLPTTIRELGQLKAQYTVLEGWKQDTRDIKKFDELPTNAQSFVKFIEEKSKKEVTFVSTSSDEDTGMLRTRLN